MTERNLNELLKNVVVPGHYGKEFCAYASNVMALANYVGGKCVNVARQYSGSGWIQSNFPQWNWNNEYYAIIPEPVTRVAPYRDAQAATFIGRTYRYMNTDSIFLFRSSGGEDAFDGENAEAFLESCEWVTITTAPNGDAIVTVTGPCGNVVEVAE